MDWKRSPFTRAHKGQLSSVRPDEFASQVLRELLREVVFDSHLIDDIIVGCAYPEGEQGYNLGRMMSFLGELPYQVPGYTINRLCGSSMQALLSAASSISSGWGQCFLIGGIESMSRVKRRGFNWSPHPNLEAEYPEAYINMGETAENVANLYSISRMDQEKFALESHNKSSIASSNGHFKQELVTILTESGTIEVDGCIRSDTSLDSMSKLKPAFSENGTVTAATSSPLTDGAVFALVCNEEFAEANSLDPLAAIVSATITGCKPDLMGLGPITATQQILERTGWDSSDVDIFEINEAFSSQSIACIRELEIDIDKVNLDGGAISLGHPLGASGARISCKAASILKRTGKRRAIATMCIGGGMGIAIALESL